MDWRGPLVVSVLLFTGSISDPTEPDSHEGQGASVSAYVGQHEPGIVAFLLEVGKDPLTKIEVLHEYRSGSAGSSSPHAADFLVPVSRLGETYDLWPGAWPGPYNESAWGHMYNVLKLSLPTPVLSIRSGDTHQYTNLNDGGETYRFLSYRQSSDQGQPLEAGRYWFVFVATSEQKITFNITNSEIVAGPVLLDSYQWSTFHRNDFATEATLLTMPVHGVGAYATTGASGSARVEGPAYLYAQVIHHNATPPRVSLVDPLGRHVELRQKIQASEGAFAGGGFVGVATNVTQIDLLSPHSGTWDVEIDASIGTRFDFRLFAADLAGLREVWGP